MSANLVDEPTFADFMADASVIDQYLVKTDHDRGICVYTYGKLIGGFESVTSNYFNGLKEYFDFTLSPGDRVVDIGAHHGYFALMAGSYGAEVLAVEPNPLNFSILEKNIRANSKMKIKALNAAMGPRNETLVFNFGKTSTTGALKIAERDWKRTDVDLPVNGLTLKSLMQDNGLSSIKVLKVDCEGAEYEVFLDMPKELLSKVEYILMETHPTARFQSSAIEQYLKNAGYQVVTKPAMHGCFDLFCMRV